jgi:hypothetical protein
VQYFSNIYQVIGDLVTSINALEYAETVSRAAAAAVMPELRERIHERGEKPDGSPIGTYSEKYEALREKKYNRTEGDKVVLSLTSNLEQSYTLAAQDNGYTIGVLGDLNAKKIEWLTERYGNVWELSQREKEMAKIAAEDTARKLL